MKRELLALILAMGLGSTARAETFSFPEHGFEMTCLDSWERIPFPEEEEFEGIDFGSSRANDAARSGSKGGLLRLWNPYLPRGTPPEILLRLKPSTRISSFENLQKVRRNLGDHMEVLSILGPKHTRMGQFDGALLDASVQVTEDGEPQVYHVLLYRTKIGTNELSVIASHAPDIDLRAFPEIEDCVQSLRRVETE